MWKRRRGGAGPGSNLSFPFQAKTPSEVDADAGAFLRTKYGECDTAKCTSIKLNFLWAVEKETSLTGSPLHLFRELMETSRCVDDNLAHVRRSVLGRMSPKTAERAVTRQAVDDTDIDDIHSALLHYRNWSRHEVASSLPWGNWVLFQAERFATEFIATFGVGAGYSVWRRPIPRTKSSTPSGPSPPPTTSTP
jgi:hypothetical protein